MFRRGNPFVRAGGNFIHTRGEPSARRAFPILAFTRSHSTKPVEILSIGSNSYCSMLHLAEICIDVLAMLEMSDTGGNAEDR